MPIDRPEPIQRPSRLAEVLEVALVGLCVLITGAFLASFLRPTGARQTSGLIAAGPVAAEVARR